MLVRPASGLRRASSACAALAIAAMAGCATAPAPEQASTAPPVAPVPAAPTAPVAPTETPEPAASTPTPAAEAPAAAAGEAPLEQRFADWIAAFRADAQAQGIDEATLRAAFDDVHFLPRIVELDRAQPEFTRTVWDYLDITVSAQRVTRGTARLQEMRVPAGASAARY